MSENLNLSSDQRPILSMAPPHALESPSPDRRSPLRHLLLYKAVVQYLTIYRYLEDQMRRWEPERRFEFILHLELRIRDGLDVLCNAVRSMAFFVVVVIFFSYNTIDKKLDFDCLLLSYWDSTRQIDFRDRKNELRSVR